jgi:hypothetical protein
MIPFKKYMLSEMSLPVRKAADAKDEDAFNAAVVSDFKKAQNVIGEGKIKGVKNLQVHAKPDADHDWPYMTMEIEVGGASKKMEIKLANVKADKLDTLTDYEFYVDGKRHTFDTKTTEEQKRTGSIAAGVSYIIYALQQAAGLRKKSADGGGKDLSKMSLAELQAEIKRRETAEKE